MQVLTIDNYPGRKYEVIGLVQGADIESTNIGKDIGASFKTLFGGEIKSYSQMMELSRTTATERMIEEAKSKGADAIIGMRYGSSSVMQGAAEMLAYGTAIKFID